MCWSAAQRTSELSSNSKGGCHVRDALEVPWPWLVAFVRESGSATSLNRPVAERARNRGLVLGSSGSAGGAVVNVNCVAIRAAQKNKRNVQRRRKEGRKIKRKVQRARAERCGVTTIKGRARLQSCSSSSGGSSGHRTPAWEVGNAAWPRRTFTLSPETHARAKACKCTELYRQPAQSVRVNQQACRRARRRDQASVFVLRRIGGACLLEICRRDGPTG